MGCALARKRGAGDAKRVQVTFTRNQWELVQRFKGILGNTDAEIVRNIVLAWLNEKSVVSSAVKSGAKRGGE